MSVAVLAAALIAWINPLSTSAAAEHSRQHWPSGVSPKATAHLQQQHWILTPPSSRADPGDEAAAVKSAVAQMGWLDVSKAKTVTLMDVRQTGSSQPGPITVWVIEFGGVSVPPMGGTDTPGKHAGGMVVLVNADTLEPGLASTY